MRPICFLLTISPQLGFFFLFSLLSQLHHPSSSPFQRCVLSACWSLLCCAFVYNFTHPVAVCLLDRCGLLLRVPLACVTSATLFTLPAFFLAPHYISLLPLAFCLLSPSPLPSFSCPFHMCSLCLSFPLLPSFCLSFHMYVNSNCVPDYICLSSPHVPSFSLSSAHMPFFLSACPTHVSRLPAPCTCTLFQPVLLTWPFSPLCHLSSYYPEVPSQVAFLLFVQSTHVKAIGPRGLRVTS